MGGKRGIRRVLVALAAVLVVGGSAVAIAAGGGRPKTDSTGATFNLNLTRQKITTCTGEDGQYVQASFAYRGTSTSPDPRLDGTMRVRGFTLARETPKNDAGSVGQTTGTWQIRGNGGKSKGEGRFFATLGPPQTAPTYEGVLIGNVRDTSSSSPGAGRRLRLIGNFNAIASDPQGHNVQGSFGGPAGDDVAQPANLQRGHCPAGHGHGQH